VSEISADRDNYSRTGEAARHLDPHPQFEALARLALAGCAGVGFIATWRSGSRSGTLRLPSGSRWGNALNSVLSAAGCIFESSGSSSSIHLGPAQLVPLFGRLDGSGQRFNAVAVKRVFGAGQVVVAIVSLHGRAFAEIEAVALLTADRFLEIANADDQLYERGFWRRRALAIGERLARKTSELSSFLANNRKLDHAVAGASRLRGRNRFSGLLSIAAALGEFDAGIVAIAGKAAPQVVGALATAVPFLSLAEESAIADSIRRKSSISHYPGLGRVVTYPEDRIFAKFPGYVCVPFEGGGFALAAHQPIAPAIITQVELFAARIAPLVRAWIAEAEVDRMNRLVRRLGLRMFAAVDTERARISRDLHDDQAQLLAAARIALGAGPEQARVIFKGLEHNLRDRLRELKPAMLGRATLEEALLRELARLTSAAIDGELVHPDRMNALPRPIQQLCYQIVRESLTNVIRHARATRVEIAVEECATGTILTIVDDGKGIPDDESLTSGIGLRILSERLELMGGKLHIDSRPGSTKLIAEIPELV
jgi:signal transduction histidine kinase